MCRKRLSSPRCRSELIDSAWVVIVPGQKCMSKKNKKCCKYNGYCETFVDNNPTTTSVHVTLNILSCTKFVILNLEFQVNLTCHFDIFSFVYYFPIISVPYLKFCNLLVFLLQCIKGYQQFQFCCN